MDSSEGLLSAELRLSPSATEVRISPNIYGHFAEHLGRCIYEGLWVGTDSRIPHTRGLRNDVLGALKKIKVPVLRWPGGCFADEYHWRDGIGPRETRPKMINTHWGGVVENNHFGTHEFMDLCEELGARPYICGNVGSGSVREMQEWVEYMTSDADSPMANLRRHNGREQPYKLDYFGVGNESWGCGGNMRPEFYADNYRRYNTFVKNFSGQRVQRIACGANGSDYQWTEVLMSQAARHMDGLSLHYYTLPTNDWSKKGSATEFGEAEWHATLARTLRMEELVSEHGAIMDKYDPERKIGMIVDEWGTWYDAEPGTNPAFLYQQNTLRDALVTAVNLNIFNAHAARVSMANLAQTVNVLQALVLTQHEKMLTTPTYHVFDLYQVHQGGTLLEAHLNGPTYALGATSIPMLHASASLDRTGRCHLSVANLDPRRGARLSVHGMAGYVRAGRLLTAAKMNDCNDFGAEDRVRPLEFSAFRREGARSILELPAKSVVVVEIE